MSPPHIVQRALSPWPRYIPIYQINLSKRQSHSWRCWWWLQTVFVSPADCLSVAARFPTINITDPADSAEPNPRNNREPHRQHNACRCSFCAPLRRRAAIKSFPPNYHPFQRNCCVEREHNGPVMGLWGVLRGNDSIQPPRTQVY